MIEDHRDASLSPDVRADLLLPQLTLEEKCDQLAGTSPWRLVRPDGSDADGAEELLRRPPGHIAQLSGDDPVRLSRLAGAIQRQLVTRTRLGIPALIHQEALNGFMAGGHMVFPTAIGLAATFSPGLVEQMADLIRRQMRRLGFAHALSPVMDVAPGESRRLTFRVAAAQLGYTNLARDFAVEPGHVEFFVGLHSDDRALSGSFELAGPARVLSSAERSFLTEVTVD